MKFKYYIGIFIAIIVGLSVGHVVKTYSNYFYVMAKNNLAHFNEFRNKVSLGGPGPENDNKNIAEILLESFPNNSPDFVLNQNINTNDFEIPRDGKAIVADLDSMKLTTFENGELVKEYKILSKGRQGTAWETPPGKFDVLYKRENHFSSIGGVWMPYSMQFFGNYFIHGWPYYPDGTPVAEGYSGGCIRMANDDMKEIYNFAPIGANVIVKGSLPANQKNTPKGTYLVEQKTRFPAVTSRAYLIGDVESGEIIVAKDSNTPYSIASITKWMTALVSLETINQYRDTVISPTAVATYGDSGGLRAGDILSIGDLLYPLLFESSNDAGEAIAEFAGRNHFIANMNGKAKSMGLSNTSFADASGLSKDNISTADDLFKLSQYIYKFKSYIFDVSRLKNFEHANYTWYSNNRFRNDDNFIGGKNGYTDAARHTLITVLDLSLGKPELPDRKIAIILLQAEKTEQDTRAIAKWLLQNVYFVEDLESDTI
jgi:hypothetical protein